MENSNNNDTALIVFFCAVFGFLIFLCLVIYFAERFRDIKYVRMELRRAYNEKEYRYWRRELNTLYWCLIPGVSRKTVNSLRGFFSRGKKEGRNWNDKHFELFIPSLLGVCLCAVCLMGSTLAWFTATQNVPTQNIRAANYKVTANVTFADGTPISAQSGVYRLEKSNTPYTVYTVTLTAEGDATTGYCIIDLGGTDIHTVQLSPSKDSVEGSLVFYLEIHQSVDMKIIPQWGSSTKGDKSKIENGKTYTHGKNTEEIKSPPADESDKETTTPPIDITESTTPEETTTPETTYKPIQYTVKPGDSLGKIAELYGTTVKRLQLYNDIENPNYIKVGDTIEIPPANWEISENATPAETEPAETEPAETEPGNDKTQNTETTTPVLTEGNQEMTEPSPSDTEQINQDSKSDESLTETENTNSDI